MISMYRVEAIVGIVVLATAMLLPIGGFRPIERLELMFFDQLQTSFPPISSTVHEQVVIIGMDEKSLKHLGQWPWPRSVHARLIGKLHAHGVKAIGIDAVFAETDRLDPQNDEMLAEAISQANVIVGSFYDRTAKLHKAEVSALSKHLVLANEPNGNGNVADQFSSVYEIEPLLRNIDEIEETAQGSGFLLLIRDVDGVARKVPLILNSEGVLEPSFSLEVVRVAQGKSHTILSSKFVEWRTGSPIHMERTGAIYLRYPPPNRRNIISVVDVLEGRIPAPELKNKIVLVGLTALGLNDQKMSPYGELIPGVAVHATAIEQMINGFSLYRPDFMESIEIAVLGLLGALLIFSFARFSAWGSFIVFVGSECILYVSATLVFIGPGIVMYPVYPSLAVVVLFGALLLMRTLLLPQLK